MVDPDDRPDRLPMGPLHLVQERLSADFHGDFTTWLNAVRSLPTGLAKDCSFSDTVSVTFDCNRHTQGAIEEALQQLHPWRKGPFCIGTTTINTEWRSDWKWQRLKETLGDLTNQRVLDIGCGNGYFGWRALESGAEEVIGIDPTILFCMQHQAMQRFIQDPRNWVLPLKVEELPTSVQFELCLSMGVLYHRRDPLHHVRQLYELTAAGGRCVLETLTVTAQQSLFPRDRYARMRNVWCVPSTEQVVAWMTTAGFYDVAVIDLSTTTIEEQRSTEWMRFESLSHSLDPTDSSRTAEGYPAPIRVICLGHKRG